VGVGGHRDAIGAAHAEPCAVHHLVALDDGDRRAGDAERLQVSLDEGRELVHDLSHGEGFDTGQVGLLQRQDAVAAEDQVDLGAAALHRLERRVDERHVHHALV